MYDKTATGLVAYAKAQLGKPYWYDTFGSIASEDLLENRSKKYSSIYTVKRKLNARLNDMGKRVHDDAGLIKGYLWSKLPTSAPVISPKQNYNAAEFYFHSDTKGKIVNMPHIEGILVFKGKSEASIMHVGIYDGEKYVYEAKGFEYGIIRTPFKYEEWQYYAYCPFVTYTTEIINEPIGELKPETKVYELKTKPGTCYLRKSPTTSSIIVKILEGGKEIQSSKKISGWYYIDEYKGYINSLSVFELNKQKEMKNKFKLNLKIGSWSIRKVPSISGEIIKRVKGNQVLVSSKKDNDWYYIDKYKGYIHKDSAKEII